jgi:hypothetical protein
MLQNVVQTITVVIKGIKIFISELAAFGCCGLFSYVGSNVIYLCR